MKNSDGFSEDELAELFGDGKKLRLPKRLNKKAMAQSDAPFLADAGDAAYIKPKPMKIKANREKSIKVLTIPKPWPIIRRVIKRKDGKMTTKVKTKINYTQRVAVCLLAGGAVLGFADQLGGGLRACAVAALLVACLFVLAIDFRD